MFRLLPKRGRRLGTLPIIHSLTHPVDEVYLLSINNSKDGSCYTLWCEPFFIRLHLYFRKYLRSIIFLYFQCLQEQKLSINLYLYTRRMYSLKPIIFKVTIWDILLYK